MKLSFCKYQGTGNDFIVFDDRDKTFPADDTKLVSRLCDRRFGIGSDGILLIQEDDVLDFYVDFINPDGSRSFCGNGSRCAVAFAHLLGIVQGECSFRAIDGVHGASIDKEGLVHLGMSDVDHIEVIGADFLLDTGSPHFVRIVEKVEAIKVVDQGRMIRNSGPFNEEGVNVNFVQLLSKGKLKMRTYERGVEDETLSCGTGITAAVLAMHTTALMDEGSIEVETRGGTLKVECAYDGNMTFTDIHLIGPTELTFSGEVEV